MSNEWDRDTNILTEEERRAEWERQCQEDAEQRRIRRENADRNDYIRPSGMAAEEISVLFPQWRESYSNEPIRDSRTDQNGIFLPWSVNKLWYVCHNCGYIGWKYGRCHQLFKCHCGSRDIDLIRAAHISKILREHTEYNTNMKDVYDERKERIRRQRSERSARRRNQ